ncbi:MAG: TrkH family potassium uptake protein [Rickettsiales bacterium]|nr:TrkH family potassium uptake protein [Rickettsiales bacterium]
MFKLRPILLINGLLLLVLGAAMIIPLLVDLMFHDGHWETFLVSAFICGFIGGTLYLSNRGYGGTISLRQTFLFTASSWFILPAFACLPFYLSAPSTSFIDAYFEGVSGLTTTGATVMTGLDTMSHGILLWRCLLQALGAVGVIVLAMAILPILRIGGMQLFRTESSDKTDKVIPRAGEMAKLIGMTYLTLSGICAIAYWSFGMSGFDAICHALTTLGTAGFSNYDASIAHFASAEIETIATLGMICGALPIILYYQMIRGKPLALFKDIQVRWFFTILVCTTLLITAWLIYNQGYEFWRAFRYASFNVASIITTTGYVSADYAHWGSAPTLIFFMLIVVGGCTGSTSGGIKIFRFKVLYETAKVQLYQLIQPHGVFIARYGHKPISESVSASVLGFFTLFAFSFMILATALSAFGLDFITSMSAAAQTLANVGPGLGEIIGPTGNYQTLPDGAKWLICIGMVVGRLELFTVLVLFTGHFWRE